VEVVDHVAVHANMIPVSKIKLDFPSGFVEAKELIASAGEPIIPVLEKFFQAYEVKSSTISERMKVNEQTSGAPKKNLICLFSIYRQKKIRKIRPPFHATTCSIRLSAKHVRILCCIHETQLIDGI